MNPFLGSTQEFNQFIQSRLPASRKAANDGHAPVKGRSNPPHVASKSGLKIDSQDFVVSNTIKYIDSSDRSRRVSSARSSSNGRPSSRPSGNPVPETEISHPPAFNFVHSWKAHLVRKPSSSVADGRPYRVEERDGDSNQAISDRAGRLEGQEVKDAPPLSPLRSRQLPIAQSPIQGLRRAALIPSPSAHRSPSARQTLMYSQELSPPPSPLKSLPFPLYSAPPTRVSEGLLTGRYREALLRRCWRRWGVYLQHLVGSDRTLTDRVQRIRQQHLQRRVLHAWGAWCKAVAYESRYVWFRAQRLLRTWSQLVDMRGLLRRAERWHLRYSQSQCFVRLLRAARRNLAIKQRKARVQTLRLWKRRRDVKRVWSRWRHLHSHRLEVRRLEQEHRERQSKIQSFLSERDKKGLAEAPGSSSGTNHGRKAASSKTTGISVSGRPTASARTNAGSAMAHKPAKTSVHSSSGGAGAPANASLLPPPAPPTAHRAAGKARQQASAAASSLSPRSPPPLPQPAPTFLVPPPTSPPASEVGEVSRKLRDLSLRHRDSDNDDEVRASVSSLVPPPAYEELMADTAAASAAPAVPAAEGQEEAGGGGYDARFQAHRERRRQLEEKVRRKVEEAKRDEERRKKARQQQEEEAWEKELEAKAKHLKDARQPPAPSARTLAQQKHFQQQLARAVAHYHSGLLVRRGLAPWLQLVEKRRHSAQKSLRFRREKLLQAHYTAWKALAHAQKVTRIRHDMRQQRVADSHYHIKLVRRVWRDWKTYRKVLRAKALAVTGAFSRFSRGKRAFLAWKIAFQRVLREQQQQLRRVAGRGDMCVCRRVWQRWLAFVQERRVDREVERRAECKWADVQRWLKK